MTDSQLVDYYEVLQVSPRADRETIERVFRHLANRYHPDNRETGDNDRFTELVDAYQVLSNPEERARFDVTYERLREARWRIFGQESATNEVVSDSRIRLAMMSVLYVARRNNPSEPGVGVMELERLLACPETTIRFHFWYLRENGYIERLATGHFAITAPGVDRLFELGGPQKPGPHLLAEGDGIAGNGDAAPAPHQREA